MKLNMKGMYDTFECGVCLKDEETLEHIYTCKEIWKMWEEIIPDYKKIFNGKTREKLNVAGIYKKNLEILEKKSWRKINKKCIQMFPGYWDQVTSCSLSAVLLITFFYYNLYFF